jgi:hypothetical protein
MREGARRIDMNRKKPILKRSNGSLASYHSPRTHFNQVRRHGGRRLGAGSPEGNTNAKKCLEWQSGYDLKSPGGIDNFLQEVIKATWEGRLGTRAGGVLNSSLRLLLEDLTLPSLERRISELEKRNVKTN